MAYKQHYAEEYDFTLTQGQKPQFRERVSTSSYEPTLLREIYRSHGIRKKKFRWYKVAKDRDDQEMRRDLGRMKR